MTVEMTVEELCVAFESAGFKKSAEIGRLSRSDFVARAELISVAVEEGEIGKLVELVKNLGDPGLMKELLSIVRIAIPEQDRDELLGLFLNSERTISREVGICELARACPRFSDNQWNRIVKTILERKNAKDAYWLIRYQAPLDQSMQYALIDLVVSKDPVGLNLCMVDRCIACTESQHGAFIKVLLAKPLGSSGVQELARHFIRCPRLTDDESSAIIEAIIISGCYHSAHNVLCSKRCYRYTDNQHKRLFGIIESSVEAGNEDAVGILINCPRLSLEERKRLLQLLEAGKNIRGTDLSAAQCLFSEIQLTPSERRMLLSFIVDGSMTASYYWFLERGNQLTASERQTVIDHLDSRRKSIPASNWNPDGVEMFLKSYECSYDQKRKLVSMIEDRLESYEWVYLISNCGWLGMHNICNILTRLEYYSSESVFEDLESRFMLPKKVIDFLKNKFAPSARQIKKQ